MELLLRFAEPIKCCCAMHKGMQVLPGDVVVVELYELQQLLVARHSKEIRNAAGIISVARFAVWVAPGRLLLPHLLPCLGGKPRIQQRQRCIRTDPLTGVGLALLQSSTSVYQLFSETCSSHCPVRIRGPLQYQPSFALPNALSLEGCHPANAGAGSSRAASWAAALA